MRRQRITQLIQNDTSFTAWIQHWQRKTRARLRVFCFPYAGGSASIFRFMSEQAPADIEICPIQLPGRESRFTETPFSSMDLLITSLCEGLLPYLDKPYAFFGHSMGALISFELACALRRSGQAQGPMHLFVSGHRAPHLPDLRPSVHQLSEPELIEALRHFNGTPEDVLNHAELLHILLPLLRADFALCETYRYTPEPPLPSPITAFGGLQDQYVSREAILAWREHTRSSFQVYFFAGDHFFLHKEQSKLLSTLSQDLFNDIRE